MHGRHGFDSDPAGEPWGSGAVSRRALLRAGAASAAVIATGGSPSVAAARASQAPGSRLTPGSYPFDDDWLFGGVYAQGAEAASFDDSSFAAVTLPHTVTALSWGDWEPASWEESWIYRRHLPDGLSGGDRVFVDFQAVMTSATVYLNGTALGSHQGGYLPFSVELTAGLTGHGDVLAVVVDAALQDVPPNDVAGGDGAIDYLQPGGIYRDAGLRIVPATFIADVFAEPVDVLSAPGLNLAVTIDAAQAGREPITLQAALLDGGRLIGSATGEVAVTVSGTVTTTLALSGLGDISLWSPESPTLYDVQVTARAGRTTHTFTTRTGFREVDFQVDGFYLNGSRYEIFGLNRHQLFPYTGMAAPARLQRRDAEIIRQQLNCNMVRCSHYPQSDHFLDACDELGLMVWEEPPGWEYVGDAAFQQLVLQNVSDMVVRDRSRPSVIVWATRLNETSSENNEALYAQTDAIAQREDGTRQTTGAMSSYSLTDFNQQVFAYDDYHSEDDNTVATLYPPIGGVPYMVSEAVGALDGAPLYRWIDPSATLALQSTMHAQVHDIAQGSFGYAGLLGWCAIDYDSLNGGDRIWHNLKWPGVLDTFRVAKPGAGYYLAQTAGGATPVIIPAFFWDFTSASPVGGPGAQAVIWTNCASLRVTVTGQATVTVTPDTSDYPNTAQPPAFVDLSDIDGSETPELAIVGLDASGVPVASLTMSSDTTRDRLALAVQDSRIVADGTDATRFTVRALDAYGNQRPQPGGAATLAVSGPATLVGDTPFPFSEYGGVGGGFVRSQAGAIGAVTLTATHPTLGRATASLATVAGTSQVLPLGAGAPRTIGRAG